MIKILLLVSLVCLIAGCGGGQTSSGSANAFQFKGRSIIPVPGIEGSAANCVNTPVRIDGVHPNSFAPIMNECDTTVTFSASLINYIVTEADGVVIAVKPVSLVETLLYTLRPGGVVNLPFGNFPINGASVGETYQDFSHADYFGCITPLVPKINSEGVLVSC